MFWCLAEWLGGIWHEAGIEQFPAQEDRQGGFGVLKCCGRLIRPKRFSFTDEEGLKILKIGYCSNPGCGALVIELERVSIFGRVSTETLRGKRARRFLEENKDKLQETKTYRQPKKNTAKGFHYSKVYWDFKKNKIRMEVRELATDRLVSREEKELKAVI